MAYEEAIPIPASHRRKKPYIWGDTGMPFVNLVDEAGHTNQQG